MKNINFKSIEIKNFLSVGNEPLKLSFETGLNVITGVNLDLEDSHGAGNAVGKSTIVDAVCFVLYGSTLRHLSKNEIVNNINGRGCWGSINFEIEEEGRVDQYVIERSLYPNNCVIYKNGINITPSTIPKTNIFIIRLINTTKEVFMNCVAMSANSSVSFMAQGKTHRRKFIEGILQLSIFSEMLLESRRLYNETQRSYDTTFAKLEEIQKSLDVYESQFANWNKNKQERLDRIENKKSQIEEQLREVKKQIKPEQSLETAASKLQKEIDDQEQELDDLRKEIQNRKEKILLLKQEVKQNQSKVDKQKEQCKFCDKLYCEINPQYYQTVCKQAEDLIKEKTSLIKALETEIQKLQSKGDKLVEQISDARKKKKAIESFIQKNILNLREQENLEKALKEIEKEVSYIHKEDQQDLQKIIKETTTNLNEQQQIVNQLDTKLYQLDAIKFLLSEEGVKSYIVKKILEILNHRLAYYLHQFGSKISCRLNEYFEESIYNQRGVECSYFNFSGGERKRIDLAMLFAFMDIRRLQAHTHINISFYDELLDSALDAAGTDAVIRILKDRVENLKESIYVITHKNNIQKELIDQYILLKKQNGFTYVDYKNEK